MNVESVKISFGKRVRSLRVEKGYSQVKLAELCGFHRTYIGMIERGERNISLINLSRISNCFGIHISELLKDI